jgi:hypothetical protein
MDSLQCFFLFTSSLTALVAVLWRTSGRDVSFPLMAYFGIVIATVWALVGGVWQWDAFTYYYEEGVRSAFAGLFALECGWQLGLPRRLWRELLFRGCCLALSGGAFGLLLGYLPHGPEGWGLRGLVGLHLGMAGLLSEVGRQERLSDFRQTAVRWMFVASVSAALNVAACEAGGTLKQIADWLDVIAWSGLCLFVTSAAFDATQPSTPTRPRG